eukprot:COSAG06_NODE_7822_length_2368_cov_10.134717_1_plen_144_part_00
MAIRVGDYKLIVGQFARCGRNPNRAGVDEDFITQRMCGWWLPMGSADNTQRAEQIAEAYALNENVSRHGAALDALDREQQTQQAMRINMMTCQCQTDHSCEIAILILEREREREREHPRHVCSSGFSEVPTCRSRNVLPMVWR